MNWFLNLPEKIVNLMVVCTSCKRNSINKRKDVGPGMELSNRMLWSTLKALIFTLSMTHRQKGLKLTDNNWSFQNIPNLSSYFSFALKIPCIST